MIAPRRIVHAMAAALQPIGERTPEVRVGNHPPRPTGRVPQLLAAGLICLAIATIPQSPASASEFPENCQDGRQASGALYLICMPVERPWNGDLVIYAHGYVAFDQPIEIPELELPDGTFIPDIINGLGYAFATTSYSVNGLAVLEGIADVRDLIPIFSEAQQAPDLVYLVGASEGGIITALAGEAHPGEFDGALPACGPIGDFRQQINYLGDFRVVFDYFFPEVLPGSPVEIPEQVMAGWDDIYVPAIRQAIESDPGATDQLLRVTGAPIDEQDPETVEQTVVGLLWYNVFATNDAVGKLGGQPFGNLLRIYRGSENDLRLNRMVERFSPDPAALAEIEANYQTTGDLASPTVVLHTTGDPIIPVQHALRYKLKTLSSGSGSLHRSLIIPRYGHCEFKTVEVLVGFAVLVFKTSGQQLIGVEDVLADREQLAEYYRLASENGALGD